MFFDRRSFLQLTTTGLATGVLARSFGENAQAREPAPIRALAFDAFPIFDPRPVFALARQLFPEKGEELGGLWRARQFEYQWIRALSGRYADFWQTTEDALVFAARSLKLELPANRRAQLMEAYLHLNVWPDVPQALETLRGKGLRLAFLSNATRQILDSGLRNARLEGVFEHVLSTDAKRTFKPDPRANQMAVEAFRLDRSQIGFVAFAGWDVAGAKAYGYPTYWINRLNAPPEELGASADQSCRTLAELSQTLAFEAGPPRAAVPA